MTSITQRVYLHCKLQIIEQWPIQRSERSNYEKDAILSRCNVLTQSTFTLLLRSSPQTHPFAVDTSALWRMTSRVRIRLWYELHIFKLEGYLTVHLPHEIIWNANLMQQGNFIDIFLARHVWGTHDLHSSSQDHHPSKNSVQKTIRCNSTSNAPDDGRMYPKHVELRIH